MRVTRRDTIPTMPQAVLATAPTAHAVKGFRGPVSSTLAR
jgi:hypothetical protein